MLRVWAEACMPRVKEEKMNDADSEIREIVDRETRGCDTQDVGLLLSVFHPDMVWPWPKSPMSHDPVDWRLVLGRYAPERWGMNSSARTSWSTTGGRPGRSKSPNREMGLWPSWTSTPSGGVGRAARATGKDGCA